MSLQKRLPYLSWHRLSARSNSSLPTCSLPITVMQTVTDSYAVPQSSLVTILKELTKVKHTNWQLRKSVHQAPPKQNSTP